MMSAKLNLKELAKARKKKIELPYAKYNSAGQLLCVLCNVQVKDEVYWSGHIGGKAHKDNLAKLKEKQENSVFKRPAPPPDIVACSQDVGQPPNKMMRMMDDEEEEEEDGKDKGVKEAEEELKRMMSGEMKVKLEEKEQEAAGDVEEQVAQDAPQALPAGFFDDPKEDAKARGMKFRDPQDVEWDKFVKEIASEDIKSNEIVGEEQEKSAVERDLDHIEEQMAQWQRVIDLEKKAKEYAKQKSEKPDEDLEDTTNMDIDNEEDEEYDEDLDWRNKKR